MDSNEVKLSFILDTVIEKNSVKLLQRFYFFLNLGQEFGIPFGWLVAKPLDTQVCIKAPLENFAKFIGNRMSQSFFFESFIANVPILYPLKTLENLWCSVFSSKYNVFSSKYKMETLATRHYSRAIWTLFFRFWAHVIWAPKLKICKHMRGRKIQYLCKLWQMIATVQNFHF